MNSCNSKAKNKLNNCLLTKIKEDNCNLKSSMTSSHKATSYKLTKNSRSQLVLNSFVPPTPPQ